MQFCEIEPDAVEEHPEGAAAADEDGLPPPVVVFGAKLYVGRYDRDFDDSHDVDEADDR